MIFRGSIPHPEQSLCTLRNHCRQWPRNTRYQADATPYLGRTLTGWIAPALCWRTYSITSSAHEILAVSARRLRSQRWAISLSTRGCHTAITSKPGISTGGFRTTNRLLFARSRRIGVAAQPRNRATDLKGYQLGGVENPQGIRWDCRPCLPLGRALDRR
jgi:hypothetical protein